MHRDKSSQEGQNGTPQLYFKIFDGATKYPVIMTVFGEMAKGFGDLGFKVNKVIDIRNAIVMMRAEKGKSRRVHIEHVAGKTEMTVASDRLTEHVLNLIKERKRFVRRAEFPSKSSLKRRGWPCLLAVRP